MFFMLRVTPDQWCVLILGMETKKISLRHGARKPQALHACVTGAQRRANQFIPIEIDETDLFVLEMLIITTLRQQ